MKQMINAKQNLSSINRILSAVRMAHSPSPFSILLSIASQMLSTIAVCVVFVASLYASLG